MELRAAESYSPVRDNECSAACKADARCSSSLEVGDIWGDERVAVDWCAAVIVRLPPRVLCGILVSLSEGTHAFLVAILFLVV